MVTLLDLQFYDTRACDNMNVNNSCRRTTKLNDKDKQKMTIVARLGRVESQVQLSYSPF